MQAHLVKRNGRIDLLRFLSSIFVFLIHCPIPGSFGTDIIQLGRYAVPYFLMISGWYSWADDRGVMLSKARRQFFSTLRLAGTFAVVYFILNSLCGFLKNGQPLGWICGYWNSVTLSRLLQYNRALFFGSTGYYVFLLLYVYVLFAVCIRLRLEKLAFCAIPVLLGINIYRGEFTDLPWYTYGNFLYTGLPCFFLGHLLCRYREKFSGISAGAWAVLLVLGAVLTFLEAHATQSAYCYWGSVGMAVALLMLSVREPYPAGTRLTRTLHRYSTTIFVVHCGIRDVLKALFSRLGISCPELLFPFVVFAAVLLVCVAWDQISRLRKK